MKKLLNVFVFQFLLITCVYSQSTSILTIEANTTIIGESGTDICANSMVVSGVLSGSGTWCGGDALPVELVSFHGRVVSNRIVLAWWTATETNNLGFEIERRSSTSKKWESAGFVSGSGTSAAPKEYTFVDKDITQGSFTYRLKQIDNNGVAHYSSSIEIELLATHRLTILPNFPNPFNPSTIIRYEIPVEGRIHLEIVDVLGKCVAELVDGEQKGGYHEVVWVPRVSSGIYISKLTAGGFVLTQRMLLLK